MIRRTIMALGIALSCLCQANAQSLYKTVYDKATAVVNNPKSSEEATQVSQFEVTALNYISSQVQRRGLEKDSFFFDSQAVNLASFVTDFQYNLVKARAISTSKRLEVIKIYRDATMSNPLFNDTDKERAYCYINDTQTYTPFSLDTDWEKAYDQATAKVKALLK